MPFTKGDVTVTEINETDWKLTHPVEYEGSNQTFMVPAGFVTDFATVPRIFFWLVPSYGAYTKAAILHDYLLTEKLVSRADADGLFRRAMRELGVPFVRRWTMWAGVRAGSRLEGIKTDDFFKWVLVAVPSVIFLLVPAVVIVVMLAVFWVVEVAFYLALRPMRRTKAVNWPSFLG